MSYNTKIQHKQGGDELHIAQGGKLSAEAESVTLSSNAGTINAIAGRITTESLTTAAGAAVTLTITNNLVRSGDNIFLTRQGGTSDEGTEIVSATAGDGSFTILIENRHASAAFDGTFIFGFLVVRMG